MIDVVEQQPADRERLERLGARRHRRTGHEGIAAGVTRPVVLVAQRDEDHESAGLVLQLPQPQHVVDAVPGLLQHSREVNASDRADVTALMFVARAGHVAAVRALLAAGARVNTRSDREWPPLLERHLSFYVGGHSPSRPPLVGGYTALRAAQEGGHTEVARLLVEAGGRD